ncbi:uncharacterized protein LOC141646534 [Silene latifolia]|uniref:uncharacterized protein LOC141646534 n=1 Tax=Silene latifolia TaxID=37657 RepID=UPI003D777F48
MAKPQVQLKLLVDTTTNKVLFAEAGKDFVDFLFHFMSLPVGTVVNLITIPDMVGCLGTLYKSIQSLNSDYFEPNLSKNTVLKSSAQVDVPLLSLTNSQAAAGNRFYHCNSMCRTYSSASDRHQYYVTDDPSVECPKCHNKTSREMVYVTAKESTDVASSSSKSNGFVKGVVTYMVMDNLDVKPMSTISGITLMNQFHVKDIGCLVEKEVQVTLKEGVAILKASMETQAVLTTVFLKKRKI